MRTHTFQHHCTDAATAPARSGPCNLLKCLLEWHVELPTRAISVRSSTSRCLANRSGPHSHENLREHQSGRATYQRGRAKDSQPLLSGTRQLVMSETLQTLSALGEFCSASSGRFSDLLCDGSEHEAELCSLIFLDVCTNLFAIPRGAGSAKIVPLTSQLGVVRACRPALPPSSAEPLRQILILCHSRRVLIAS